MKYLFILWLALGLVFTATAQQPFTITESFTNPKLQPSTLRQLQWCSNTHFAYVQAGEDGSDQLIQATIKGKQVELPISPSQLEEDLKRFPLLHWEGTNQFWYSFRNQVINYDLKTSRRNVLTTWDENGENADIHPKSKAIAFTKGRGLYIVKDGQQHTVVYETNPEIMIGKAAHRSEFGITKGTFWSEPGNKLAFYRQDESMVTDYPLVDVTPYPAKVNMVKYPMAGHKSHHTTVGIYNLATKETIYLKTGEPAEQYLTNITFSPDENHVYVAVVNRDQDRMQLNKYDATTGAFVRTLFTEEHPKYVEPENGPLFVANGQQFVWQSERDGYNHLYLYTIDGLLVRQLTKGSDPVLEVHGLHNNNRTLLYEMATNNGLDRQYFTLSLSSYAITPITSESGVNNIKLNDAGTFALRTFSNVSTPYTAQLIDLKKGSPRDIHSSDNPLVGRSPASIEMVELTANDGTTLNGRILKPHDFDPSKKYPVIVYLYGGPHAQMVTNSWLAGANLWFVHLTQQGFIVFTMDNRGSANRGLAYEQATHRQLGKVEAEDQLKGIDYLKGLNYVDANRIGIHGWSFGGFMTVNLLTAQPGLFKAGVAGGPVIDWGMYEIMYTERYMNHPGDNQKGYDDANLLLRAGKLKDRLLIIHGTDDDVVVWQHSQLFVRECVRKGVQLDYFIYPGHKHNVGGKDRIHLLEKITGYFKDFL